MLPPESVFNVGHPALWRLQARAHRQRPTTLPASYGLHRTARVRRERSWGTDLPDRVSPESRHRSHRARAGTEHAFSHPRDKGRAVTAFWYPVQQNRPWRDTARCREVLLTDM